jgi:seryl-tRNA synthetase
MLLANYLRENKEAVKTRLQKKNFKQLELVAQAIDKDTDRKKVQNQLDELLSQGNKLAEQIGSLMKAGQKEEATTLKTETANIKEKSKELQLVLEACEKELHLVTAQGKVLSGADAVLEIWKQAGHWSSFFAKLFLLAPFIWLARPIYSFIARNRRFFS